MRPLRFTITIYCLNRKVIISPHLIKSKGIHRTVEQLFNFKFEVFRSKLRLHWFSIGLRFRDEDP
jgi:hypothetical protein